MNMSELIYESFDVEGELSRQMAEEIDKEILKELFDDVDMQYDTKKQQIDPSYLHEVKRKTESLLQNIIHKYNLDEYISIKYRYRLDKENWYNSKYHELYKQRKDINGKILMSGREYVPVDFDDWSKTYLSDYYATAEIYGNMCEMRRVIKEDLIALNKIAKKYKVNNEIK